MLVIFEIKEALPKLKDKQSLLISTSRILDHVSVDDIGELANLNTLLQPFKTIFDATYLYS